MATEYVFGDIEGAAKLSEHGHAVLNNCHSVGYTAGTHVWSQLIKNLMMAEVAAEIKGDKEAHSLLASGSCHNTIAMGLVGPAFESIFSVAMGSNLCNWKREDAVEDMAGFITGIINVALPATIPHEFVKDIAKDSGKSEHEVEREILSIRRELFAKFNLTPPVGKVTGAL